MYISNDYDFNDLRDSVWGGAKDTLDAIAEADKVDDFLWYMEESWSDRVPNMTEINDWLWFDSEYIFADLGLDEDGKPKNEEEDGE